MRTWLCTMAVVILPWPAIAGPFTPTPTAVNEGARSAVDLPANLHMRNTGGLGRRGPGTGAGLCVFTSCEVMGRWLRVLELSGFQKWMTNKPGGGSPPKLDAMLRQYCAENKVQVPLYIQHTGGHDEFLDLAVKTGRGACVTYAGSDDFYSGPIDHMVFLAHLDTTRAAILDNNRPGRWIWMSRSDFLKRWRARGGGWAVVFLAPPPPPYSIPPVAEVLEMVDGDREGLRMTADASAHQWRTWPESPGRQFLFDHGRLIGMLDEHGWHKSTDGRTYEVAAAGSPPIAPPAGEAEAHSDQPDQVPNYGLDRADIHQFRAYWISGSRASESAAKGAVGGDSMPDDSNRANLYVTGPPAFQSRVRADLARPEVQKYLEQLHVRFFDTADWEPSQFGLPQGVGLRAPARARIGAELGSVLQDVYDLAKLLELLSRLDGPKPDVSPANPTGPGTPTTSRSTWWMVAAGAVFLLYITRGSPQTPIPQTPPSNLEG